MKPDFRKILRIVLCGIIVCATLAPVEADGARKRKRKQSTHTTRTTSTRKSSSSSRVTTAPASAPANTRRSREQTVTQETRDAARKASAKADGSNGKTSALTRIKVDKPDLDEIRTATLDPKNKFYFPNLMNKYQAKDTTMTPEEFRYLYLGYMFQEDYDPYRQSPYSSMTDPYRSQETFSKADRDTIQKYAEKALLDNPFDLRQMSFLVHVLKEKKKNMKAKIWEYRLENLLGAIKSTGTGEDEDNAWYVIYPMHEYDMVQLLGYEAVDVDYIEPGFDYLKVQPDGTVKHRSPAKGFYFNIQVPQQQYELKHPEEDEEEEGPQPDDLTT